MILLDANAVIALVNDRVPRMRKTFHRRQNDGETISISSIVVFELRYGVANSRKRRLNGSVLDGFLSGAGSVMPFDEEDARVAAEVRAVLASAGTPIGPYDLLIAGQALRHGATLVTANTREFSRVPGLGLADWARGD